MLIGVLSYRIDPTFAEFILGEGYVDMTRANIRNGDPMAVYKAQGQFNMFLAITLNNIYVALQVFIMGAFFAVGSVFLLMSNGIMVGVFQYFFVDQGLFRESFLTIWVHGAIEISSIVIAGAAGLVMGSGLLFPGTFSRRKAFARSARAGFKIMLGTVPLFIIAGFIESFLTRQTQIQDAIRLAFILLCFAFIVWYYWYYPRKVASRPSIYEKRYDYANIRSGETRPIVLHRIKMLGEILTETMLVLGRGIGKISGGIGVAALVFCLSILLLSGKGISQLFVYQDHAFAYFHNLYTLLSTLGFERGIGFFLSVVLGIFTLLLLLRNALFELLPLAKAQQAFQPSWSNSYPLLLPAVVLSGCFALPIGWLQLAAFLLLPFLCLYTYLNISRQGDITTAFRYCYTYLISNYGLFVLLSLLGFFVFFLLDTAVTNLIFGMLSWTIFGSPEDLYALDTLLQTFIYFSYFGLLLTSFIIALGLNFHSNQEKQEAPGLKAAIAQIGQERRLRGLKTE